MKAVKRSLCPELCKDCPIMQKCRECDNCGTCRALTITKLVGLLDSPKMTDCFCLSKMTDNEYNRNNCVLKEIAIYEGRNGNG